MNRAIGYLISLVGIAVLALSVEAVRISLGIDVLFPFISGVSQYVLMVIGAIIIVVGVFVLRSSGRGRQHKEVPIYHGKDVVGFRRMGK